MSGDRVAERRSLVRTAASSAGAAAAVAGAAYGVSRIAARRARVGARPGGDRELELPPEVAETTLEMRDGGRIRVLSAGEGSPMVLLHGAGLGADAWAYQFRDLSASHRVVAPDLRGHGGSDPGTLGVTIDAMAGAVAELLEARGLTDVLLVGHSMGGMVALRLARKRPEVFSERVRALVLASTTGGVTPDVAPWNTVMPLFGRAAVAADRRLNGSGRFAFPVNPIGLGVTRVAFGSGARPAHVEATARMLRRMRPSTLVRLVPEIVAFDERAPYTALGVPAVVVVGDRDRLTPPAGAWLLAETLPGARLVVYRGAGHMVMFERRSELSGLLSDLAGTESEGEVA